MKLSKPEIELLMELLNKGAYHLQVAPIALSIMNKLQYEHDQTGNVLGMAEKKDKSA